MKFIDANAVHNALDYSYFVDAMEQAHLHDTEAMDDLLLEQPGSLDTPSHFFIRAAWQKGRSVGAKVITIFPDNNNDGRGNPSIQAIYVLFDGDTGAPLACIDGAALTARKTAGDSALGAKHLARQDIEHMFMIGAGSMAPHLIMAHCATRPSIRKVSIWNRTKEKAEAIVNVLIIDNVQLDVIDDIESGVRNADLVSSAIATPTPVIKGAWLKPGTHVDLVGAFTKTMREADDEVFRRAKIYVDSRASTVGEIGEITIPLESGVFAEDDIIADHYQLSRGEKSGRTNDDDITVCKNGGGGHLDLMTARLLYDRVIAP